MSRRSDRIAKAMSTSQVPSTREGRTPSIPSIIGDSKPRDTQLRPNQPVDVQIREFYARLTAGIDELARDTKVKLATLREQYGLPSKER